MGKKCIESKKESGELKFIMKQIKKDKLSYKTIMLLIITVLLIISNVFLNSWSLSAGISAMVNKALAITISIALIIFVSKINLCFLKKNSFYIVCFLILVDLVTTLIQLNLYGLVQENYKIILVFIYLVGIGCLLNQYEKLASKKKYVKYIISVVIFLTAKNSEKAILFILLVSLLVMFIKLENKCAKKCILHGLIICMTIVLINVMLILLFGEKYQVDRLRFLLTFGKNSSLEKNRDIAVHILRDVKLFENIELFFKNNNMIYANKEVYIVSYIAGAVGLFVLFIALLLYGWQIGIIGSKVVKYQDEEVIGISILGTYVARIIYLLAICTNMMPINSISLPFMSCDIWILLFDSLCIGYFMNKRWYR